MPLRSQLPTAGATGLPVKEEGTIWCNCLKAGGVKWPIAVGPWQAGEVICPCQRWRRTLHSWPRGLWGLLGAPLILMPQSQFI